MQDSNLMFMKNFSGQGMEEMGVNLQDLFKNMPGFGNRTRKHRARRARRPQGAGAGRGRAS